MSCAHNLILHSSKFSLFVLKPNQRGDPIDDLKKRVQELEGQLSEGAFMFLLHRYIFKLFFCISLQGPRYDFENGGGPYSRGC